MAPMVNGTQIPTSLSQEELTQMLSCSDMVKFVAACKYLENAHSSGAYQMLKKYIHTDDLYKRRCVIDCIYQYPQAAELSGELEAALSSKTQFMVSTALSTLIRTAVPVRDEKIIFALQKGVDSLDAFYFQVIGRLAKTNQNYEEILKLYKTSQNNTSVRIAIAESLIDFSNLENYSVLFSLFSSDSQSKIRMAACRIAKKFCHEDWLTQFQNDVDGHIRKFVAASEPCG